MGVLPKVALTFNLLEECMNSELSKKCVRTAITGLFAVAIVLLFSVPSFAQLNFGRISGGITDQTGGAIAGAMVTVIDVDRGIPRSLTTDESGQYSAPSLIPGNYTVRA